MLMKREWCDGREQHNKDVLLAVWSEWWWWNACCCCYDRTAVQWLLRVLRPGLQATHQPIKHGQPEHDRLHRQDQDASVWESPHAAACSWCPDAWSVISPRQCSSTWWYCLKHTREPALCCCRVKFSDLFGNVGDMSPEAEMILLNVH